jgi:hypothetical protein
MAFLALGFVLLVSCGVPLVVLHGPAQPGSCARPVSTMPAVDPEEKMWVDCTTNADCVLDGVFEEGRRCHCHLSSLENHDNYHNIPPCTNPGSDEPICDLGRCNSFGEFSGLLVGSVAGALVMLYGGRKLALVLRGGDSPTISSSFLETPSDLESEVESTHGNDFDQDPTTEAAESLGSGSGNDSSCEFEGGYMRE